MIFFSSGRHTRALLELELSQWMSDFITSYHNVCIEVSWIRWVFHVPYFIVGILYFVFFVIRDLYRFLIVWLLAGDSLNWYLRCPSGMMILTWIPAFPFPLLSSLFPLPFFPLPCKIRVALLKCNHANNPPVNTREAKQSLIAHPPILPRAFENPDRWMVNGERPCGCRLSSNLPSNQPR